MQLDLIRPLCFVACFAACSKAPGDHPPPATSSASAGSARSAAPPGLLPPDPSASAATPSAGTPRRPPRNVLLLTVDSLRTDVPWQGYGRPIAPNLTALSERAAIYSRAYAGSSYTAKSVATFLSGRYPSTLYRDGRFFTRYAEGNRFLAELLAERGIRSSAWHGHLYFGRNSGFEQGFSTWKLVPGIKFDPETDNDVTSEKMTALGIEILGTPGNTKEPFFAWAHYMDPHDQYLKHAEAPDFGKKARDRYDSEIWYADHFIGKLLEFAATKPWWQNTVVIVSADHGEAFGEHGMYKHAFELWEVLTRVPLFLAGPGIQPRRIEERRSHIDLAPTILELMGAPVPADMHGQSMLPELEGAAPGSREPILTELSEDSHNPPRRAIIAGDWKLIEFERGRHELFNLATDPGETRDLAKSEPAELRRMKALLDAKYQRLPTIAPHGGGKLREGGRANGPQGPADQAQKQ
jgi:choline-sulfatase